MIILRSPVVEAGIILPKFNDLVKSEVLRLQGGASGALAGQNTMAKLKAPNSRRANPEE